MATIQPTYEISGPNVIVTWDGLDAGDVGASVDVSGFSYRSMQFIGALSGSTFSFAGSNDNATFVFSGTAQYGGGSGEYHAGHGASFLGKYGRPEVTGGSATGVKAILVLHTI